MAVQIEGQSPDRTGGERIGRGLACSLVLHGGFALLIVLGLRNLVQLPPQAEPLLPVDLVTLGAQTAAPQNLPIAALPQARAPQAAGQQAPGPVPVAQVPLPTPQATRPRLKLGTGADRQVSATAQQTSKLPAATKGPTQPPAATPAKNPPPPSQDLQARLQSLTMQQQLQASTPRNNWQQDAAGSSTLDAASANAALGTQATYSVKDFLRAQIERHWYMDKSALSARDFTVSIHMVLDRDGSVASAEILPDPSYATNAAHRDLAFSARDAVRLSSPLQLPPGTYDLVKDMTLTFRPRDVLQ